MKIINDRNVKIFANDYNGKKIYSMRLSKKDINGNYINGYISCRFKKNIELKNKTTIKIKDAWLDFYLSNKVTIPYIFINDFEIIEEVKDIVENKEVEKDAYEEMGDIVELTDADLPFDFEN